MIFTLAVILLTTLSGLILTYLYEKGDSLLVRLAAGNVIGSAIFGTIAFVFACFFGFSTITILFALIVATMPCILLITNNVSKSVGDDFKQARTCLSNANLSRFLGFLYYTAIFIVLILFFNRTMIQTSEGIFTGGSQNLGDLPFHLGAIFSFTEGNNFPPENPSFAGAKFTYPFLVDFITACFVKLGADVREAMFVQNVILGFSLAVLIEKFTVVLTKSRAAGRVATLIFYLSGGLGFAIFLRDYWHDGRSFLEFIWHLSSDYTIRETIRWGNPLVVLFMTQRGFLLGMPIVLIILTYLWRLFSANEFQGERVPIILMGLLAGTIPLIHVHSLFVIFIVCGFLFFFSIKEWKGWILFAVSVSIIAIPELFWSLTGSASNLTKFMDWHFGWDARDQNFFVFWLKNLGLFIPLLFGAIFFIARQKDDDSKLNRKALLLYYLPFAFIFILCNIAKLAPWEWDNIKVLIYWYLVSVPFVGWLLVEIWKKGKLLKALTLSLFFGLIFSGSIDIWRVISKQIDYQVFSKDAVSIAEQIKQKTTPNALFLNAPTYNTAVVLSGRRSLMRYVGHLSSYGIDYEQRERDLTQIYLGSGMADYLLAENKIDYVIVSPEVKALLNVNDSYFLKFPKIAEVGAYKVYKIK